MIKISMSLKKSPLIFFVLVFALSLPFWLLGFLVNTQELPIHLPASALMFVCPLIAACILVSREGQSGGVRRLLRRAFDHKNIKRKIWYVPIIFSLPLLYILSYIVMRLIGRPLPTPSIIPFLTIPIFFVVFFLAAIGEEVGWMGYAIDPMQSRWGALKASIILGVVWQIWHIVPDLQAHNTAIWIVWHSLFSISVRILMVWIYNNTGKSVFAVILVHTMDNVSWTLFPNYGSGYDPFFTCIFAFLLVVIVVIGWGPKTLARYRYIHVPQFARQAEESKR